MANMASANNLHHQIMEWAQLVGRKRQLPTRQQEEKGPVNLGSCEDLSLMIALALRPNWIREPHGAMGQHEHGFGGDIPARVHSNSRREWQVVRRPHHHVSGEPSHLRIQRGHLSGQSQVPRDMRVPSLPYHTRYPWPCQLRVLGESASLARTAPASIVPDQVSHTVPTSPRMRAKLAS